MASLRRFWSLVWPVLRYALGPAGRHTQRALNWWPVLGSIGVVASLIAGFGGFASRLSFSWWLVVSLGILTVLFLRAAVHFYNETHPEFPRHSFHASSLWYYDIDDDVRGEESRILILDFTYFNREPRRVAINIELMWYRDVKGQVLGPYSLSSFERGSFLEQPVSVGREDFVKGKFGFYADSADLVFEFGDLMAITIHPDFRASLLITDHVTDASVEKDLDSKGRLIET